MSKRKKLSERDIRRMTLLQDLFVVVKLLDMMNDSIQHGAEFDEEAEDIAVDMLIDLADMCEYITEI